MLPAWVVAHAGEMMGRDQVREIARVCYSASDEIVGIIEFLEAGNTVEVSEALMGGSAHVAKVIRKAMMSRLVMSLMRMHDKDGRDREGLRKAFDLLGNEGTFQALAVIGDKARLQKAIERWNLLSTDPRVEAIRNTRDFEIAHHIPLKKSSPRPRMMDLFCIAEQTLTMVEDLAAGVGINSVSFETCRGVWASKVEDYWSSLIRSQPSFTPPSKDAPAS
ncbi:MAG: hypothetical protein HQL44_15895 [Alphaproteobacteria bacterium]|nr:hypothetical protein [Alphaproteobacteria bacterium]